MPPSPGRSTVADAEKRAGVPFWETLRSLSPYLWPEGRWDLKQRIIWAMMALVAAKVFTLAFPLLYGKVVDVLNPKGGVEQALTVAIAFIVLARQRSTAFTIYSAAALPQTAESTPSSTSTGRFLRSTISPKTSGSIPNETATCSR